jgi:hypothetical protein
MRRLAECNERFRVDVADDLHNDSGGAKAMKTFRVTFMERTGASGQPSEKPTEYVAIDLPDGVVRDKQFVERTEPAAMHSEDSLEEDDDFLSVGSETWDYEVARGREDDFIAALQNSQMVMEYVLLEE